MRIQITNQRSVRLATVTTALFAVMLFLAGCVVTSIYPYYTDKDLVFDQAVLGDWVEAGQTNQTSEYVRIEPAGGKGYRATIFGADETNSSDVYLFQLKQQLFLDTCSTNRSLDFVPVHQVSKVIKIGPALETVNLNYDWLKKMLGKNPGAIRHMVLQDNKPDDKQGGRIVLTADTKELQRFLVKYVDDTNAWKEPSQFKRLN